MPKYRNATNRVLILNGVKIPPGGVIETTEELAKQAKGALVFVPDGPVPRVVSIPTREGGGLSEEDRQKLKHLESMFEDVEHMFENLEQMAGFMKMMPEMMKSMQENLKEEIKNQQPTVIEKTVTVQGTGGGDSTGITDSGEPVPVILDEPTGTVESNLADSSEVTEKEADSVQSKLDKLRKLKGAKNE